MGNTQSNFSNGNTRDLRIVYGYIRLHSSTYEIPDDLINLCYRMYHINNDYWSAKDSHKRYKIEPDSEETIIQLFPTKQDIVAQARVLAYGSVVICKGHIESWKIQIINKRSSEDATRGLSLDLSSTDDPFDPFRGYLPFGGRDVLFGVVDTDFVRSPTKGNSYALSARDGRIFSNVNDVKDKYANRGWDEGDVITMTLDLTSKWNKKHGHLSFAVNGQECGVAFNKIDLNKQYRMAVSMMHNNKIKLIKS